jgi:acyl carrier protein
MTLQQDPKTIAGQLCQFARKNYVADGADFDENSPLAKAGIDSFALVELLLFCERSFGVSVPDSHLTGKNLASVASLANCIAELAGNNHASP